MRDLHSIGFIHNDIKPDNLLIDTEKGDTIYMIDFGLSEPYRDHYQKHIEYKKVNEFTGNFIFASLNQCQNFQRSRRDDLESAFYMVVFLLNKNRLPWDYLCTGKYDIQSRMINRMSPLM